MNDQVIIGSTAIKYWYEYYIGKPYFHTPNDLDITSYTKTRKELWDLNVGDIVMNDGTELNMVKTILADFTEIIDNKTYLSPEALAIYYLSRPRIYKCKYERYVKDVMRLRTLRYILIAKGSYWWLREAFEDYEYNDFHLLFYINKYFYRLNPWRNTKLVIAGEWAILAYQELLLHTHHYLRKLDIHHYNSRINVNYCGSMMVPLGQTSDWNEIEGFKLEPISNLISKESNPKVIKRLNKIRDLYPAYE
jgi:hypothetical protein